MGAAAASVSLSASLMARFQLKPSASDALAALAEKRTLSPTLQLAGRYIPCSACGGCSTEWRVSAYQIEHSSGCRQGQSKPRYGIAEISQ